MDLALAATVSDAYDRAQSHHEQGAAEGDADD
jgi:hypothetical protein